MFGIDGHVALTGLGYFGDDRVQGLCPWLYGLRPFGGGTLSPFNVLMLRLATLCSTTAKAILPGGSGMKYRNSHKNWTKIRVDANNINRTPVATRYLLRQEGSYVLSSRVKRK